MRPFLCEEVVWTVEHHGAFQMSFDPDYRSQPLSLLAPMVREVFARKACDPAVLQKGVVKGLPLLQQPAAA